MASLFSQENLFAIASEVPEVPEKVFQNDDAASTASGDSSPVSLPSSPERSEISSPMKISDSPETPSFMSPEALKDLPSLGSLGHCAGLCKRCCFHEKGRCLNGYNCRFCHFDHDKRQRKKKIDRNAYGLSAAPVHRQLENRGFRNEAWGASVPPASQYVSAPPGLEQPCPPPPPLGYPVVNHPAPVLPPTAPPASPAPTLLGGPIAQTAAEAPQTDACQKVPICAPSPVTSNPAEDWSIENVAEWLTSAGLSHLSQCFEDHRITGDVLIELISSDLEEIGIKAFGDKKRVLKAVAQLKTSAAQAPGPLTPPPSWQAPMLETNSPWASMPPLTPPPSFDATAPLTPPPSFDATAPLTPPPSFDVTAPLTPPPSFDAMAPLTPPPSFDA